MRIATRYQNLEGMQLKTRKDVSLWDEHYQSIGRKTIDCLRESGSASCYSRIAKEQKTESE